MRLKNIQSEILMLCAAAALASCATPPPQIHARQQSSIPPPPGMCERPGGWPGAEPGSGGQVLIQRQEGQQRQAGLGDQEHAGTQGVQGQQGQQGGQDTDGEGDFGGSTGSSEMPTREQPTGATGGGREYVFQRNEGSIEPGVGRWIGPLPRKRVPWSQRPAVRTEGCEDDVQVLTRQLCEAATKEEDPVLRSALWDEYNGYKKILIEILLAQESLIDLDVYHGRDDAPAE